MRQKRYEAGHDGPFLLQFFLLFVIAGGNIVAPRVMAETPDDSKSPTPVSPRTEFSPLNVERTADRLVIRYADRPVAEFVFHDPRVLRPYFAKLHSPSGLLLTRNHPPVPGMDATDHETMHPGLWLAMGDVSGYDFWRNQGRIEHIDFSQPPEIQGKRLTFATKSRLVIPDGRVICQLENRFDLCLDAPAWLLVWEATFRSDEQDFYFGDQEEMGLGVRVATALTELSGGEVLNSNGQRSAARTWGQPAQWCDYSGPAAAGHRGVTLIPDPRNFRESWWHSRDYGLLVANPFGRAAMHQGPVSRVTVKHGESFRLRFAAVLHDGGDYDPAEESRRVLKWFELHNTFDSQGAN